MGAINYEIQRRAHIAEQWVESKRSLHSTCPKYDPNARDSALAKMQKAAEAGEFQGLESMKSKNGGTGKSTAAPEGPAVRGDGNENSSISADNNGRAVSAPGSSEGVTGLQSSIPSTSEQQFKRTRTDEMNSSFHRPAQSATSFSNFNFRTQPHSGSTDGVASAQNLLNEGKPIEAAHHFLDETRPFEFSDAHHALAVHLLYASLKQRHTGMAVRIFRRINTYGTVTPSLWLAIMHPLGKMGNWETLSEIYCRYSSDFEVPTSMLRNTIMNGLIYNTRFRAAKEMVLQYLDRDTKCRLCATYLEGLRKYARSVELVESEFKRLLVTLSELGLVVTERLFHPLLRTYINFGYDEKAERLVHEMQMTYDLGPSVRILGMFASGKALKADWDGVDTLLEEMAAHGRGTENVQAFRRHFDRIFLEYFLSHSGQEIRDFVFRAVDNYGLLPDEVLFNHIVMAYIQKGNRSMMIELVETAEKRLWQVNFDIEYFLNCLRGQRMGCETGSVGLWPMFRAAQQKFGRAPSLNRILDFDKSSFPNLEALKAPYTGEDTRSSRKAESVSEITRPIDNYAPLVRRMVINMHVGKYDRVLKFYRDGKRAGKVMNRGHVKLAVIASIFHHASWKDPRSIQVALRETKSIIEGERDTFLDLDESVTPSLFRIILESDHTQGVEPGDLKLFRFFKKALFLFYKTLEELKLPVKHNMLTSLSLRTQLAGRPRRALAFVRTVNQAKHGPRAFFDVFGLTIIARCCALCGNLRGVRWAILSGLKRRPAGLGDLVVEVDTIIERFRISQTSLAAEEQDAFAQEVESLRALALAFRRDHTVRTDQPSEHKSGRPGLKDKEGKPMQNVSEYGEGWKEAGGDGPRVDESLHTRETLANWDERVELEKALAPRDSHARWNLTPAYPEFKPSTPEGDCAADEATASATD